MENNILFIVNPISAAKKTKKEWPQFEEALRSQEIQFDVVFTEYPEHATLLARQALKSGYSLIVSVGGDGTMNEVVNGFYENHNPINSEARLAVFSRGTGCDFIRSLEIEKDLAPFVALLKRNRAEDFDLGFVKYTAYSGQQVEKYFLNISDIGIGGETTHRVNRNSKILKGFLSFLIGALTTIITYKNKQFYVVIDDKTTLNEKLNCIVIANGKYFGGGMKVAPNALFNDGLFDIITIGDLNKLELIKSFPTIYKGTHLDNPKVKQYRGQHVIVKCNHTAMIEIDGEQPGAGDAEFKILPRGIKLLK